MQRRCSASIGIAVFFFVYVYFFTHLAAWVQTTNDYKSINKILCVVEVCS